MFCFQQDSLRLIGRQVDLFARKTRFTLKFSFSSRLLTPMGSIRSLEADLPLLLQLGWQLIFEQSPLLGDLTGCTTL